MVITEPREPPPDYRPERVALKMPDLHARPAPAFTVNDMAQALYKGWPHDTWALRHWRTKHNCHVEHWHGESAPGGVQ